MSVAAFLRMAVPEAKAAMASASQPYQAGVAVWGALAAKYCFSAEFRPAPVRSMRAAERVALAAPGTMSRAVSGATAAAAGPCLWWAILSTCPRVASLPPRAESEAPAELGLRAETAEMAAAAD